MPLIIAVMPLILVMPLLVHQQSDDVEKKFFVKAKLPAVNGCIYHKDVAYIMSHIEGYKYEYTLISEQELQSVSRAASPPCVCLPCVCFLFPCYLVDIFCLLLCKGLPPSG